MKQQQSRQALAGQTMVITGANRGIGRATAEGLARMGPRLVLVCRNAEAAETTVAALRKASGNPNITYKQADLSRLADVRRLAAELNEELTRLDVLLNNAAIFTPQCKLSVDGYELQFAVNHLAPFLLTQLLLDKLKASAPARIVTVSSEAHRYSSMKLDNTQGEQGYSGVKAYGATKGMNILFTYRLARELADTGVTANCLHPGGVATELGSRGGGMPAVFWRLFKPFMIGPETGAKTSIFLASSPQVQYYNGYYFMNRKPARSSSLTHDRHLQDKLWDLSLNATGLQAPVA
jgi:NAD(P)-dependent dehydrogenase (short-subunit alcohol dehydrogenase family)